MQRPLELFVIRLAERNLARPIEHAVQFFPVHPCEGASPAEQLPEPAMERQAQHLLPWPCLFQGGRAMPRPTVAPIHLPVGRAITGPAKARGIDERLQPMNRMCVEPLPLLRNKLGHATQNVRGQVLDLNPGQNQKARVVGQQVHVALARFLAPAEVTVAHLQVARRALPSQARDHLASGFHQILQVLAHRLLIAQIVILLHQAVEQRLLRRAAHLYKLQRSDARQWPTHRDGCRESQARAARAPLIDSVPGVSPAATRSRPHGEASTAIRGKPCRATRHWPASTAKLHKVAATASSGSAPDDLG